eukprot:NODE_8681_length_1477_cov_2.354815.p1 GENE.NODE_8681_length_1477_cov_2.354815~~NODE_8681_length_1477_cov_2.354815.p1  ORF type:complete len:282 (+),score=62.57 NODE_8681_length_1477_cov_2.354815:113-958(+)
MPTMGQKELDNFMAGHFANTCIGSRLVPDGGCGGGKVGRAFVGFVSHQAAMEAKLALDGMACEDCTLRAEWARSEYRPDKHSGAGGGNGGFDDGFFDSCGAGCGAVGGDGGPVGWQAPDVGMLTATPAPVGPLVIRSLQPIGGRSSFAAPPSQQPLAVGMQAGGGWQTPLPPPQGSNQGGGGSRTATVVGARTLHFKNLPFVSENEFSDFVAATFLDQIVCMSFVDANDGRPPVSWVLFIDEAAAALAVSSHRSFEWRGSQVMVQYARKELDPTKVRARRA